MKRAVLLLTLAVGAPAGAQEKAPAPDAEGVEFFEKKIRPVLVDACYSCHSPRAKSLKGGLRLDTRDTLRKGGDSGPAIVPGDPDKSLLIQAIRGADENIAMPPKKRLPKEVVADFEAWVRRGAPDPRSGDPVTAAEEAKVKAHWSFKPPVEPAIPAVRNVGWGRSPIDAFVLAKLEAAGFKPQPEADRRTLIRRVTFDLTGLPPTPQEVDAFVASKDPKAYEKAVDRLLASPAYGERWARHWLDVARYSDTKGYVFQEERRYPFAYTFRDWVVRAFNDDMSYDRFVTLQIAADRVVTGEDKRDLAAMGFLTVGRRFLNNQADIIDDRIDVVTRGFMALTVGCARCHDHKYDPIPIKDYYSLFGVFASSEEPKDLPVISTGKKSPENLAFEKELEKLKAEVEAFRAQRLAEKVKGLRSAKSIADHLLAAEEGAAMKGDALRELARKKDLSQIVLERWIARVKKDEAVFGLWKRYAGLPDGGFAEKARGVKVDGPLAEAFKAPPASLKEAAERYGKAMVEAPEGSSPRKALHETTEIGLEDLDKLYNRKDRDEHRAKEKKIEALKASHAGAPEHAMVMTDRGSPIEPRVFIRGNPNNLGPHVPRRFLSVLAGENAPAFKDGSGRLELARAIASKDNPLTARVLVNRVWGHHFGRPLVGTPSDFGLRSDPPSHPELLDWLALRFVEDGWSVKALHRRIVLSSTYRQSSVADPALVQADPENRLLGRMNRRRLEFEALRDAILAVSGQLDRAMGGRPEPLTSNPTAKQRMDAETIRNDSAGDPARDAHARRRSIYLFIDRQNLPQTFRAFDFASPDTHSPQRFMTTVPQQALYLMNSPFVLQQAERLSADVASTADPAQRVRTLHRRLYGRDPAKDEVELGLRFVNAMGGRGPSIAAVREWTYGFGAYDEKRNRVAGFTSLPHFTGMAWQGGATLPDPARGWVLLTAQGGHPGSRLHGAAVRRWTAPDDAVVSVEGLLAHKQAEGDGVLARIVSSREGQLASWTAHNTEAETRMSRIEVKKGDTLDFVVECRGDEGWDNFEWAPVIRTAGAPAATAASVPLEWSASVQFAGPSQGGRPAPDPWARYAHVLLLSNEFVFVD